MTSSTEIEPRRPSAMGAFDETDNNLIRYLGLNANNPKDQAAVAVCKHYGFDPLLKHVVVIDGVYITRDGLLHVAHRSGQLDGIVVDQDPTFDIEENEWKAKVSVYRKDMSHPFTFPGRYPADGGNKKYAQEMALKAAEAHALRRAFDVTGLPTLDEQQPNTGEPGESQSAWVTSDEITAPRKAKSKPPNEDPRRKQLNHMFALLGEGDCPDREDQLIVIAACAGLPVGSLEHRDQLTDDQLRGVVNTLNAWQKAGELGDKITEILNTASLKAANEKEAQQ